MLNIKKPSELPKRGKYPFYVELYNSFLDLYDKYVKLEKENKTLKNEIREITNKRDQISNEKIHLENVRHSEEHQYKKLLEELKIQEYNKKTINDLLNMKLVDFKDDFYKEVQRDIFEEHIKELENKIIENPDFINPFYICNFEDKNYLIDGQHRYTCCKNIKNTEKYNKIKDKLIKLEIVNVFSKEEMKEKYNLINFKHNETKSRSDDKINWKIFERKIINYYKEYFKTDTIKRCNKPYVRINQFMQTLKDNLEDLKLVKDNKEDELFKRILNLNKKYYYDYLDKQNISGLKTIRKKFYKNNTPMFFFGIQRNWLTDLINIHILQRKSINEIRPIITSDFREMIWRDNIGIGNAKCLCCLKEPITRNNHHLGHIIPLVKSGLTNRYNLLPICGHCNTSMGPKIMYEYMIEKNINVDFAKILEKKIEINPSLYKFV